MTRGEEETSTRQASRRRGPARGARSASHIVSSLIMEELKTYCEVPDNIDLRLMDKMDKSTTGGEHNCGPYPIHGPARLAFKWKENVKRKMWVDFRVLENPSPRRNGFTLESPLTFIFIFKWGKSSKNKKPQ